MKLRIFALLAFCLVSGYAQATVLTFDSIDADNACVNWGGSIEGFTIEGTTAGFVEDPACSFLNSDGAYSSPNMMVNFNSEIGTFVKDSGTFHLNGAYFHADDRNGNTMVTFAGYDESDNLVFSTTVEIGTDWQWVAFEQSGLKKFTWDPVSPSSVSNVSVDNFTYDGAEAPALVPVPSLSSWGIALAIMALLLVAGYRLRVTARRP